MAKQAAAKKPEVDQKAIEGQFPDDPAGWARYWGIEFKAAREEGSEDWPGIKAWQETGARIVRRYRNKKKSGQRQNDARINIFSSNIQTQRAILVGNTPKCEVSRRFEDPDDDVARVASDMAERILNSGLEEESKGLAATIARCTEDRLLPGMCGSKVEFSAEFEAVPEQPAIMAPCPGCQGSGSVAAPPLYPGDPAHLQAGEPQPCPTCHGTGQIERAPAVPASEKPVNETADASYIHWRDQLWSPARTWQEVRWWAFGADMSKKEGLAAFGPDFAGVPMNAGKGKKGSEADGRKETPWSRARVWEIWSKEHQRVFHFVEGSPKVLTHVDNPDGADPLGLEQFWPFPAPMMANAVSDAFLPTPDFEYAKDLYNEADELTSRIRGIVRAIKVAGVYDQANAGIRRLLDEACELELIPVAKWTEFMRDKGGLAGAFQLLPIAEMVATVQALVQERNLVIEQIFQITGLGDIIRGQQQQTETATTSAIKARFASVRLQDLQKEVARYATDLQRLRFEVIAKHWSIETIIQRSSILKSEDGKNLELVMQAAQLIKSDHINFRVVIKPEQISLQDWAQLKQQRGDVLTALGQYFGAMVPFIQMVAPAGMAAAQAAIEMVLRNGQWLVAGMPGSSGVESSLDSFVAQLKKAAQDAAHQPPAPPKPDPKVQGAMIKAQGDVAKTQAATQGRLTEIAAETRANMIQRQHDAQMDVATDQAKSEARMRLDAVKAVQAIIPNVPGGIS